MRLNFSYIFNLIQHLTLERSWGGGASQFNPRAKLGGVRGAEPPEGLPV